MSKFRKNLRLCSFKEYGFVFKKNKKVFSSEIIILGRENKLSYPRVGFIITKKNIKYAHDRNRIKRLLREYFRLNQKKMLKMDFVVLIKKCILDLNNFKINKILKKLWGYYFFD